MNNEVHSFVVDDPKIKRGAQSLCDLCIRYSFFSNLSGNVANGSLSLVCDLPTVFGTCVDLSKSKKAKSTTPNVQLIVEVRYTTLFPVISSCS